MLDFCSEHSFTSIDAILGEPGRDGWSWRRILVTSQVLQRRFTRKAKMEQEWRDRQETHEMGERAAAMLEGAS